MGRRPFPRLALLAAAGVLALAFGAAAAPAAASGPSASSNDPRLSRARDLLRSGRAQQAFDMYSSLWRSLPDDPEVQMGLAESAILTGDKVRARGLIESGLAANAADPDWIRLRGMLLASEGKRDEALATWRKLLVVIPDHEEAYRATAGLLAAEKMAPEAIALLIEGRQALHDSLAFSEDLASLYDLTGKPDQSVVELARAIAAQRVTPASAIARSPALEPPAAASAAEGVRALAASYPKRAELLDYLAWLRVAAGDCMGASAAAAEADRLSGLCSEHRMALFGFIRADTPCEEAGLGMVREALASCPPPQQDWPKVMALADRLVELGEFAEARDLVHQTLDKMPQKGREAEEGLLKLGGVLLDGTREPAKARDTFKTLLASCSRCPSQWPARLGAARSALLLGDYVTAEGAFQECLDHGPDDETREAALFGLAETRFFSGDFAKAGDGLRQLIMTYPKGRLLNDAVERMVFLGDNVDAGEGLLKSYAEALRLGLAGNAAAAIQRFDEIVADFPLSNLRDDAALESALLVAWSGDDEAALAKLDSVVAEFPESPVAPRAILEKANIRWRGLGDVAGAREECERLLLHYSDSLLADEARSLSERLGRIAQAGTQG